VKRKEPEENERRREQRVRRREIVIIFVLLWLSGLLFYVQTHISYFQSLVSSWKVEIPFPNNVLIIALIGLNIILLLLLCFLILRNVVKMVFERKKRVLGSKLRTKLVMAFILLSLIPPGLLFFTASQLITSSIEKLFSVQVEGSLQESLVVAQIYYQNSSNNALHYGRQISQGLRQQNLLDKRNQAQLADFLKAKRLEYNLEAAEVVSDQLARPIAVYGSNLTPTSYPALESKILKEGLRGRNLQKFNR